MLVSRIWGMDIATSVSCRACSEISCAYGRAQALPITRTGTKSKAMDLEEDESPEGGTTVLAES